MYLIRSGIRFKIPGFLDRGIKGSIACSWKGVYITNIRPLEKFDAIKNCFIVRMQACYPDLVILLNKLDYKMLCENLLGII